MSTPQPPEPPGYTPPPSYAPPPPPPTGPPAYVPPPAPPAYPAPGVGPQPGSYVRYAGFWIRFVAAFIDGLIIGIPLFIVSFALTFAMSAGSSGSGQASSASAAPLNGLGLLLGFAYFAYFWSIGATLGMRVLNLRVVDAQTMAPMGFGKAALRYVGYVISTLACYIGLIWAAFDSRKQGWHDKIAGTYVIHA